MRRLADPCEWYENVSGNEQEKRASKKRKESRSDCRHDEICVGVFDTHFSFEAGSAKESEKLLEATTFCCMHLVNSIRVSVRNSFGSDFNLSSPCMKRATTWGPSSSRCIKANFPSNASTLSGWSYCSLEASLPSLWWWFRRRNEKQLSKMIRSNRSTLQQHQLFTPIPRRFGKFKHFVIVRFCRDSTRFPARCERERSHKGESAPIKHICKVGFGIKRENWFRWEKDVEIL